MDHATYDWLARIEAKLDFLIKGLTVAEQPLPKAKPVEQNPVVERIKKKLNEEVEVETEEVEGKEERADDQLPKVSKKAPKGGKWAMA